MSLLCENAAYTSRKNTGSGPIGDCIRLCEFNFRWMFFLFAFFFKLEGRCGAQRKVMAAKAEHSMPDIRGAAFCASSPARLLLTACDCRFKSRWFHQLSNIFVYRPEVRLIVTNSPHPSNLNLARAAIRNLLTEIKFRYTFRPDWCLHERSGTSPPAPNY